MWLANIRDIRFKQLFSQPKTESKFNLKRGIENPFEWMELCYLFIKELNYTEDQFVNTKYINILTWLLYFKSKENN